MESARQAKAQHLLFSYVIQDGGRPTRHASLSKVTTGAALCHIVWFGVKKQSWRNDESSFRKAETFIRRRQS